MEAIKLVKFGERKYMDDLYHEGKIYMNTVEFFRTYEDKNGIGDEFEGVSYILRNAIGEIRNDVQVLLYGKIDSLIFRNENDNGNIFCLTALWKNSKTNIDSSYFELDEKLTKFGDSFVLIHNPKLFTFMVEEKLKEMGMTPKIHAVKYENVKIIEGEYGIFSKPKKYDYQEEVRVFVNTKGLSGLEFELGPLKEIASIHSIEELFQTN